MPRFRALFALVLISSLAQAGDWPQWLGPTRDGVTTETVAPWKKAPETLWRQSVGEGHTGPVVAGGRVFLFNKVKDKDEEELVALNSKDGEVIWRKSYSRPAFTSEFGNGPRSTPAVSGGRVYTFGVTGILTCFDAESGKIVWQEDAMKKFKAPSLTFGFSCSPLVDGDQVLVNVGAKGASVASFDKDKGTILWQSQDDPASYSSPIVIGKDKERQIVFLTGKNVLSLNPKDGSLYWKSPLVDLLFESSTTPVKVGDMLVASSVTFGSVGLQLDAKDDKPASKQAWKNPGLTCYFSTPVAVGKDHLYLVTGTIIPPPQVVLRVVDIKTGKEIWKKTNVGKYHASLMRTGDNKLLMLDDAGNLILLDPNLKGYKELARSKVCGDTWAHPALADGKLYVRDKNEILSLRMGE